MWYLRLSISSYKNAGEEKTKTYNNFEITFI